MDRSATIASAQLGIFQAGFFVGLKVGIRMRTASLSGVLISQGMANLQLIRRP